MFYQTQSFYQDLELWGKKSKKIVCKTIYSKNLLCNLIYENGIRKNLDKIFLLLGYYGKILEQKIKNIPHNTGIFFIKKVSFILKFYRDKHALHNTLQ
ncbi:hypothetical protein CQA53_06180 [Helicobacter didelphidarum]|uniref:Uncharacterized protein n=1 Tax=Helicobacter didelphidarum TaxID=2040648 RepID=A0A3D8IJM6_9HELI|nr:hypothetical protein [Helicobacter didelphidarum]RDU65358.1 hypothetical protein CQA53_06180 [Helicobacter didelphidarum]